MTAIDVENGGISVDVGLVIHEVGAFDIADLISARLARPSGADVTTVTVISEAEYLATPSLGVAGGMLIAPARLGGGLDFDGDTHFRYSGGPSGKAIDPEYVGPANDVANATMLLHPEWINSRGVSRDMIKVKTTGTTLSYRLTIGELWETELLRRVTVTANAVYYIVVDYPLGAATRRMKVELLDAYFGGVIPTVGETVTRAPERLLYVGIGDSFFGGASLPPDGASRLETSPNYVAQVLGMDFTNMGIGGTGWDAREANHYSLRVPSALAMGPALLHLAGSRNDATDDSYVYAAAVPALVLTKDVPVVYVTGPAQSSFSLVNTALRNAVATSAAKFGDMINVITAALTGPDNIHPRAEGHRVLAIAMLAGMDVPTVRAILAAIQRTVPGVTLGVSPAGSQQVGSNVTLTATVSSPVAVVGSVDFYAGTAYLGRAAVVGSTATLIVSTLPIATYQLSARFVPSANKVRIAPSVSPLLGYTITNVVLSDIILTNLLVEASVTQLAALADGAAITALTPTRGSKLDTLTQASGSLQMVKLANDGDGKPSMKQTGAQGLPAPVWAAPLAVAASVTLYAVFRIVSHPSANTGYILNRGASTAGYRISDTPSGVLSVGATAAVGPPNQVIRSGWQVMALRFDAGQCTIFQNRMAGDLFNISYSTIALAGIGIGSGSSPGTYEVHHRDYLAYSGAQTDDEIRSMLVYLAGLWNVTLDA